MGIFALGLTLYAGQTVRSASVTLRGLSAKRLVGMEEGKVFREMNKMKRTAVARP